MLIFPVRYKSVRFLGLVFTILALTTQITACNDSSNSSSSTITGSVFAAPVDGAVCELQDTNGASIIQNSFSTNANGEYSVNIQTSRLNQDMVLSCTGGSYTDEATGASTAAGNITAYVASGTIGDGDQIHATPESTIIQRLVTVHNLTLIEAENAFAAAFNYDVDTSIAPTNANSPGSNSSDAQKLAGLRAAAFSQLTMEMGLSAGEQLDLLNAIALDLKDGTLDGKEGVNAITINGTIIDLSNDIQDRFTQALLNFHNSNNNATGLGNEKLGALPFAKTVMTTNHIVEYLSGMMMTSEGMSQFQIRVTDRSNDTAATGLNVTLMPMMNMANNLMHSTPAQATCAESTTLGTYDCTVFYIMPSVMASGISMGYWDLQIMVAMNETAHFYPTVMMAMGDTAKADLKGSSSDQIMSMSGGTENRRYHIFNAGLTSNNAFTVFIAAREGMMSMPALVSGTELNTGTMYALTPGTITAEMSLDGTSWTSATTTNDGFWSADLTGISGMSSLPIYVRLTIDTEQKTTNGMAPDGMSTDPVNTNEFATFTVTPGGSSMGN